MFLEDWGANWYWLNKEWYFPQFVINEISGLQSFSEAKEQIYVKSLDSSWCLFLLLQVF